MLSRISNFIYYIYGNKIFSYHIFSNFIFILHNCIATVILLRQSHNQLFDFRINLWYIFIIEEYTLFLYGGMCMTFLTNEQQEQLQLLEEQLAEAIAQFHFQTRQAELHKIIEQALAKPSPPYQPTPRGCGLVEENLCENTNK